jgi:hypothetical protein
LGRICLTCATGSLRLIGAFRPLYCSVSTFLIVLLSLFWPRALERDRYSREDLGLICKYLKGYSDNGPNEVGRRISLHWTCLQYSFPSILLLWSSDTTLGISKALTPSYRPHSINPLLILRLPPDHHHHPLMDSNAPQPFAECQLRVRLLPQTTTTPANFRLPIMAFRLAWTGIFLVCSAGFLVHCLMGAECKTWEKVRSGTQKSLRAGSAAHRHASPWL